MGELPDITGFAAVTPADWLGLRQRLVAIGLDAAGVAPLFGMCPQYPEDDRNPIRLWHLRRRSDAASLAMRLLMCGDPLTAAEAVTALGEPLYTLLYSAGLLVLRESLVHCVLRLAMAGEFYVFADDLRAGGDVVMGMRETTAPLWRAVVPARKVGRVLDLGCGAGAIALLLCRHAVQVVATDINPRAVALARVNVTLNGVDNIEVREGDLFAPVAGEAFDIIAAHPPYIALPDRVAAISHLHGGPRGDELACRLVGTAAPFVAPDGHLVVQAHWPLREAELLAAHIREAAGPDLDMLVLRVGASSADELATFWGRQQQRSAATVAQIRGHYARLGLVGTEASLTVLRRGSVTPAWTAMLDIPQGHAEFVTADRIDRLVRGLDLLHGTAAALLAARLRLPEGTSLATIAGQPGTTGSRTMLMLPPATLRSPVDVTPAALQIFEAVHRAATVAESCQPLAAVREGLARGVLEPVET